MKQKICKALAPYSVLRRESNLFRYLLYTVCARIGDSIDAIAYSWIAYQISGSASWLAIIAGINMLPTIFLTPFIAPLVEKWPKKPVMILSSLMRGLLVCLTGVLMLTGVLTVWHLAAITFCMSVIESLSDPAFMACVPQIIPSDKMEPAVSLRSIVSQVSQLLGAGLGGVLIGVLGGAWTLAVDGSLFLLAALPLLALRLNKDAAPEPDEQKESYLDAFRGGFSYFAKNASLVVLCLAGVFFNVLAGPIGQLEAAAVVEILHLDAFALSVGGVASSAGMLLGSVLYPLLSSKLNVRRVFMLCSASLAVGYVGFVLLGYVPVPFLRYAGLAVLYLFLMGCVSLFSVMANVLFFKVIAPEYLSRMASIFNAFACLGTPLASLLGGTLSGLLPLFVVFLVCGALCCVQTLIFARMRSLGNLEESLLTASNAS